jgi:hypothetical protein
MTSLNVMNVNQHKLKMLINMQAIDAKSSSFFIKDGNADGVFY